MSFYFRCISLYFVKTSYISQFLLLESRVHKIHIFKNFEIANSFLYLYISNFLLTISTLTPNHKILKKHDAEKNSLKYTYIEKYKKPYFTEKSFFKIDLWQGGECWATYNGCCHIIKIFI